MRLFYGLRADAPRLHVPCSLIYSYATYDTRLLKFFPRIFFFEECTSSDGEQSRERHHLGCEAKSPFKVDRYNFFDTTIIYH